MKSDLQFNFAPRRSSKHVKIRYCLAANLCGATFLATAYERVFVTITHLLFNGGSRIGSKRTFP